MLYGIGPGHDHVSRPSAPPIRSAVTLQFEDRIDISLYLTKMVRYEILLGELLDIDGKLAVFNNVLQVYLSVRCVFSSSE